ncbi:PDDEXK family nuclease [Roseomonas rosulenta]|uniref:hypothetical protein n=1 Tax=Roseomonas rosulenta TaxID=2748667 RepID=UPI0018E01EAD|nr:hypothetical protein [Roseomonas rosulenta]
MTNEEPWRKYRPIPVEFAGVRYRSRLEARWAALFTNLGWSFRYEPQELPGWAPDFLIDGPDALIFVEVKPALGKTLASNKMASAVSVLGTDQRVFGMVVCEGPVHAKGTDESVIGTAFGWDRDLCGWCWGSARLVTRLRRHSLAYDLHWGAEDTCLLAAGNETSGNVVTVDQWTATTLWSSAWSAVRYVPRVG